MPGTWLEDNRHEALKRCLGNEDLSEAQQDTLQRLEKKWRLAGQTVSSRLHKARNAVQFARFLGGQPFKDATREDVETYLAERSEEVSDATLNSDKRFLKAFYKELLVPDAADHPDIVSWIQLDNPLKSRKLPSDLVTPQEVKAMASATSHPRDKALIMVLYESAVRNGELCQAQVRDVEFDKYGARLLVDGKTGQRKVRLIRSVPDLRTWLNHHPRGDEPAAPLFVSFSSQNRHGPLKQDGLRRVLKHAARDAGIEKNVYPHLFRHARLTELAKELSESELKVVAGWAPNSSMAKVYIHLSGDAVDEKILRTEGLLDQEQDDAEDVLEPRTCPRCDEKNSAAATYCSNCSLPLDEDERQRLIEEDEKLREKLPKLLEILKDPEVTRLLEEKTS